MNRRTIQLIFLGIIACVAVAFLRQAGSIPYPSHVFPRAVIISVLILCALCAGQSFVVHEDLEENTVHSRAKPVFSSAVAIGTGLSVLYALCINILGFYASTFIFLTLMYNWWSGRTTLPLILGRSAGALAATALTYLIFARALAVQTPKGFLF